MNVMCRLFMDPLDDPFRTVDAEVAKYTLGRTAHFILVDVHGEATSEKQSMGHHFDGRVSAVLGTHSHIPTADSWVLPGGTAYQTDVGMCGDYDSVIGMKKEGAVLRFIKKMPGDRLAPAEGEGTMCAALVETDDKTGLAKVGPADPDRRAAAAGRLNFSILYSTGAVCTYYGCLEDGRLTVWGKIGILLMLNDFSPRRRTVFRLEGASESRFRRFLAGASAPAFFCPRA